MNDTVLLRLQEVEKDFAATDEGGRLQVLRGLSLEVKPGETLSIVGPSGSGKSTLLNLIGALDLPTSGEVFFDGENLATLSDAELALLRNRKIGFIFQSHHLLPQCTVLENVLVPVVATGAASSEAVERGRRLLNRVGLGERLKHRPGQLSGGERQRVAVVRALINQPRLLLADEPTGALDRRSADNLADLLLELNREEQVALIIVTHSEELAQRTGRALTLRDGRLEEAQ
jgi:lipoprotein-releasing system ATP-binding protein